MKIFTHLHIHYHDQTDFFIEKMRSLEGLDWDLTVTLTSENQETKEKLRKFKPDVRFVTVENTGYDIWPFIKVMQTADLDEYDLVIKLHTKRGYPKKKKIDYDWRDSLTDAILNDKAHLHKIIRRFETDSSLGMVSSLKYLLNRDFYDEYVEKELNNIGLSKKASHACMGAMFMARAEVFKPLQQSSIDIKKFNREDDVSGTFVSMAHIYERILSHLPENAGLRHIGITPGKFQSFRIFLKRYMENTGRLFFCLERRGPERKKVLEIFGVKVYESSTGKAEGDLRKLKELFHE